MSMQISISNAIGGGGGSQGGTPTPPTPPPFADTKSFQFDGITDYIDCGDFSAYDNGDLSVSAWVYKTTTTGVPERVISNSGSSSKAGIDISIDRNENVSVIRNTRTSDTNPGWVNIGFTLNNWHHISATYKDSTRTLKIYLDGVLRHTKIGNVSTNSASIPISIGCYSNGVSQFWQGNIDEVSLYNAELSQSDILSIFNGGVPDSLTAFNPILWIRMGEKATWNGSKFTIENQGSEVISPFSIGITPSDPNPTTDVPLFDNKSFTYDGISDYVSLGSFAQFLGNKSLSMWLKFTDSGGARYATNLGSDNWGMYSTSGKIAFFSKNVSTWKSIIATTTTNDGQWHHYLGVNDGTNLKLFIDGVLDNSNTDGSNGSTLNADSRIGARWNGLNTFNGSINDVSIFDTDQSANALTIFNGGVPNDISALSPISYWRAEQVTFDGTNWTLIDQGSGGNNGTSVSMPLTARTSDVPLFDNKSFTYDGVSDFITMGNVLNMADDGTDSFSCSFWMKKNAFSTELIVSKSVNGGSYNGFYIGIASGRLIFMLGSGTSPNSRLDGRSTNYVIGTTWNNVILTYDGSQDISGFNIYINGVSDAIVMVSNNTPTKVSNTTDFQLSGRAGTSLTYGGGLNEVAFFDNDQSANVSTIFNGGVPNDISALSPLGYWRAEQVTFDGTDWTLIDQGSGANNGTSVSMPLTSRTSDVPT